MANSEAPAVVVESIEIHAPVEAVFAALTSPDELPMWWGEDGAYQTQALEADLRVGGAWKSSGRMTSGQSFTVGGVYRVVEPFRALEFTWRHGWQDGDDPSADTIVHYDLEPRDGGTLLTVTHSRFVDHDDRNAHAVGWKRVLSWLRRYVENRVRSVERRS